MLLIINLNEQGLLLDKIAGIEYYKKMLIRKVYRLNLHFIQINIL